MEQKILILAANPQGTKRLRLDEEVREIHAGLQRAKKREQFVLEQRWAVRSRDILRAMVDFSPKIVHFSGHGAGDEGLVFEDETGGAKLVDGEALAGLFKLFAQDIECVVLNGCYSEVQANAITQHINYVIGMSKEIGDRAAIEFAVGFYDALGAGNTVEFAYEFGCAAIRLAGISEQLTPILKKKPFHRSKDQPLVPNEPSPKNPNAVRREIITKTSNIFAKIFAEEEHVGIPKLLVSIKLILGVNFYNLIYNEVSKTSYREFIEKLINKGRLDEFLEELLKDEIENLGSKEKKNVVAAHEEIINLINRLQK